MTIWPPSAACWVVAFVAVFCTAHDIPESPGLTQRSLMQQHQQRVRAFAVIAAEDARHQRPFPFLGDGSIRD